ncbi:hypothetical protein SALBM135S_08729 [Streptomyces alboniger]
MPSPLRITLAAISTSSTATRSATMSATECSRSSSSTARASPVHCGWESSVTTPSPMLLAVVSWPAIEEQQDAREFLVAQLPVESRRLIRSSPRHLSLMAISRLM